MEIERHQASNRESENLKANGSNQSTISEAQNQGTTQADIEEHLHL